MHRNIQIWASFHETTLKIRPIVDHYYPTNILNLIKTFSKRENNIAAVGISEMSTVTKKLVKSPIEFNTDMLPS